jgi:hypothetical protein
MMAGAATPVLDQATLMASSGSRTTWMVLCHRNEQPNPIQWFELLCRVDNGRGLLGFAELDNNVSQLIVHG